MSWCRCFIDTCYIVDVLLIHVMMSMFYWHMLQYHCFIDTCCNVSVILTHVIMSVFDTCYDVCVLLTHVTMSVLYFTIVLTELSQPITTYLYKLNGVFLPLLFKSSLNAFAVVNVSYSMILILGNQGCTRTADCHRLAECTNEKICRCKSGYDGDGKKTCFSKNYFLIRSHW